MNIEELESMKFQAHVKSTMERVFLDTMCIIGKAGMPRPCKKRSGSRVFAPVSIDVEAMTSICDRKSVLILDDKKCF